MAAFVLAGVLAWTLFAFGGVYPWALTPALVTILLVAVVQRPAVGSRDSRVLDWALIAALAAALLQLVPLPLHVRDAISPSAADFHQRVSLAGEAWPTLSLAPGAWLWGIGTFAMAVLCFWIAREAAHAHGARLIARSVAWMGLVASLLAVIQPALFPNDKIYGIWQPLAPMAHPAGPIVSRNHFAAWVLLALPLTLGYLAAHARTHWINRSRQVQFLADTRALWLTAAAALMAAALFVTHSRAGILGFGAAAAFGLFRGWRRTAAGGRLMLLLYAAILLAAVLAWSRLDVTMDRFDQALAAWGGRPEIWRESAQLAARFWPAGVGLGAFDFAMAVYQTATRSVLFNHAHNQYLHMFVEGGVLVSAPLFIGVVAFLVLAARRLREDRTPIVHLREGALAGVCGLAVQSIWETPLLTPVVLMLLAVAAGIAVHNPAHDYPRDDDDMETAD